MEIIAKNHSFDLREHDARLRKHIASRSEELKGLRGLRWLVARIKIEIWAWRKTYEEMKHLRRSIE